MTTPTNEAGHGLPELPQATDLMPEAWTNDCQGKQDFDSDLMALSCRYYPPNYRADGKHSVNASIVWGVGIGAPIAEREFAADNESMVKAAAEDWARVEVSKVIKAAAGAQGEVPQRAEFDYVDIANRVQHATGKSVFPSTVKAILTAAGSITPQPAAADGGVRERARELLAAECGVSPEMVNKYQDRNVIARVALRAIEKALTQQTALSSHRQSGDVAGLWPSIPSIQRWKMERGSDGHRWSVYMDHCKLGEWCKWEEVQQAWFCQALALRNAATPSGADLSKFRELAERWRQEAEDNKHLGGSWHRTDLCNTHAAEILALVEKGAGS